jgi:hypothetical protein
MQQLQLSYYLLVILTTPHIGGKVPNAPPMNKWLIPIQVVARTFDETMVPI